MKTTIRTRNTYAITSSVALLTIAIFVSVMTNGINANQLETESMTSLPQTQTQHHNLKVNGINISYRKAELGDVSTILLRHSFPNSSHLFRNLTPQRSERYHVRASDYAGFANREKPSADKFDYSYEKRVKLTGNVVDQPGVKNDSLYLMDSGIPIGFRMTNDSPLSIDSLIFQNGQILEEEPQELRETIREYRNEHSAKNTVAASIIKQDGIQSPYGLAIRNKVSISSSNWNIDFTHQSLENNPPIQLQVHHDSPKNFNYTPQWQTSNRKYQHPALIMGGKNNYLVPAEGAYRNQRNLNHLQLNLLDTEHFALQKDNPLLAGHTRNFTHTVVF
jgi:pimeloyl-ACP methyl ester carboxylesterase